MKQKNRKSLFVELLEDRWVPATVRLINGGLIVSDPFINDGTSSLTLTATANNMFLVMDGSASLGTYSVAGNIYVFGNNATNNITVDLNGFTFAGNVLVIDGNANDSITVTSSTGPGSIAGNVTVLTGYGNTFTSINPGFVVDVEGFAQFPFTVGGNVQVTSTGGPNSNDSFALGRPDVSSSDNDEGSTTSVGGNLGVTNVANVGLGQGDIPATVGGSLVVRDDLLQTPTNIYAHNSVTVGGNTSINTGNGAAALTIEGTNALGSSTQLSLGNGNNSVVLASNYESISFEPFPPFKFTASPLPTTIAGNFSLTEGNGNNTVAVEANDSVSGGATIQGNANLQFGDGNNTVSVNNTDEDSNPVPLSVDGNLNVTAGNGNNAFNLAYGTVNGNLDFALGNGNDSTTLVNAPGGQLIYNSGNGNDSLTLAPTASSVWNLLAKFSTGSDTLNLAGAGNDVLTGSVDLGGPPGGNMFVQGNNWILTPYFTLKNP